MVGTLANDLTQDHTRSLWWLLNAPQAAGNVIAEAIAKANKSTILIKTKTFSDFDTTGDEGQLVRRIPKQFDKHTQPNSGLDRRKSKKNK